MNFRWDFNTIRWYQEAEMYSGFYKNIAGLIGPRLEGYSRLCDIGCGLGLVDLELSKYIKSITCIDINSEAIEALKRCAEERKIKNIEPRLMDCSDVNEGWDVIYISFFGSHNLERFLPFCKKLIAVVNKNSHGEITPKEYKVFKKNTVDQVEETLSCNGIRYTLTEASFEFGQPFISLEDARSFVKVNSPEITEVDLASHLSKQLIETGEIKYPFFIPHMKTVGIFEVEGKLQ